MKNALFPWLGLSSSKLPAISIISTGKAEITFPILIIWFVSCSISDYVHCCIGSLHFINDSQLQLFHACTTKPFYRVTRENCCTSRCWTKRTECKFNMFTSSGLTVILRAESSQAISTSAWSSSFAALRWDARTRTTATMRTANRRTTQTTTTTAVTLSVKKNQTFVRWQLIGNIHAWRHANLGVFDPLPHTLRLETSLNPRHDCRIQDPSKHYREDEWPQVKRTGVVSSTWKLHPEVHVCNG